MTKTITDYHIQALIDNELDREQEKSIMQIVQAQACAKKRYEELKRQKKVLQVWAANKTDV
ncbi:MAG: hypothetical protein GC137_09780 [Alphaproteobacteria bacterium]|nr:hypothetical protein [Alphaproteobacteria bacterium]